MNLVKMTEPIEMSFGLRKSCIVGGLYPPQ